MELGSQLRDAMTQNKMYVEVLSGVRGEVSEKAPVSGVVGEDAETMEETDRPENLTQEKMAERLEQQEKTIEGVRQQLAKVQSGRSGIWDIGVDTAAENYYHQILTHDEAMQLMSMSRTEALELINSKNRRLFATGELPHGLREQMLFFNIVDHTTFELSDDGDAGFRFQLRLKKLAVGEYGNPD
jgi:hypothetical protein